MKLVFAGVMLIVSFITNILSSLFGIFLQFASKKFLIIASVLGVLATFVSAFYILIESMIEGIAFIAPAGLSQAASLVVPDNLAALTSIHITARIARFAYEWNVKVLQWRL